MSFAFGIFFVGCTGSVSDETSDENTNGSVEEVVPTETLTINFGLNDNNTEWYALNDDVMGGVSTGTVSMTDETLLFDGYVSTDNNGGFVSLRSPNEFYDFSRFSEVVFSYRSQGHSFTMILADQNAWYEPKFELEVLDESDEWITTRASLYDFKQYAMTGVGEVETGVEMSPEHLSDILRIELMNTNFESGGFELELDYIEFQSFE